MVTENLFAKKVWARRHFVLAPPYLALHKLISGMQFKKDEKEGM